MKRIHYAGGSLLTGDAIADVVLRYAQALAKRATAEEIRVPSLTPSGTRDDALLLVGPASQLLATAEEGDDELEDDGFVERYERLILALGPRQMLPLDEDSDFDENELRVHFD
ncbi:hypothetical protein [Leifsonia sp. NPDC058248]|uniref:hypothetical protein n=1 Tax=Leifsonia sp. NPDC058248 TaxID=3346402 RepID=UPI0036DF4BBA